MLKCSHGSARRWKPATTPAPLCDEREPEDPVTTPNAIVSPVGDPAPRARLNTDPPSFTASGGYHLVI
jgi:hypothetical protein